MPKEVLSREQVERLEEEHKILLSVLNCIKQVNSSITIDDMIKVALQKIKELNKNANNF